MGSLKSCFHCGLVDHMFDECHKIEKNTNIKFQIYIDFNDVDDENEKPLERNSSIRESKTWSEVQPKRMTKPLGSKTGFNPIKGHFDLE